MPTREEVFKRLAGLLNEKMGGQKPCAMCGKTEWRFSTSFVSLSTKKSPRQEKLGKSFPLIPLICGHCGNTQLINLIVLGVKDLDELKLDDPDEPDKS